MNTTLTLIAALAVTLTSAPAMANDPSAAIQLNDLDLSRPADVRTLERRIASAKEQLCGSYANRRADEVVGIDACRAGIDRQLEPRLAGLRGRQRVAAR